MQRDPRIQKEVDALWDDFWENGVIEWEGIRATHSTVSQLILDKAVFGSSFVKVDKSGIGHRIDPFTVIL